jgi:hypothetical protein
MQALNTTPHEAILRTVVPSSIRAARLSLARSQCSHFPTRLAIARWTSGGDVPQLPGQAAPLRAAWFARAERDFQAWLEQGGFVQHDDAVDDAVDDAAAAA